MFTTDKVGDTDDIAISVQAKDWFGAAPPDP